MNVTTTVAKTEETSESFIRNRMKLAFLSPAIQKAIIEGSHPSEYSIEYFIPHNAIPLDWQEQEIKFDLNHPCSQIKFSNTQNLISSSENKNPYKVQENLLLKNYRILPLETLFFIMFRRAKMVKTGKKLQSSLLIPYYQEKRGKKK